ncbi:MULTISPECIES: hypothetical protein [unclassified Microcoleus]|uniref:hypothetical protein n=1 Tax=unclassified Microcoleus TaxID=2642155 RepID=UPI002FD5243E
MRFLINDFFWSQPSIKIYSNIFYGNSGCGNGGRQSQVPGVRTISVPISTAVVIFTSIELTLFYCNAASFLPDRIYQG